MSLQNFHGLRAFVEQNRMRDPFGSGLFLHLSRRDDPRGEGGAGPAICTDIIFTKLQPNTHWDSMEYCAPNLSAEAAQGLMDSLWNAGVRPAGMIASTGQLAALENHLRDMRHLAFKGEPPK